MDLNTQQEVHLSHYWNVIRKRWKVATAILTIVMLGTFLASYFAKPLYQSKIRIQIDRESNALTVEDLFGIAASDQEFLQTQYVLLQSRGLALQVVEDHKLHNDPELNPQGITGKSEAEIAQIKEGIAGTILGGISVVPVRNTALVDILYVGTSPQLAKKVAEAWGESYMRMNITRKLNAVQEASEFLTRQIAALQQDLDHDRQQLQAYGRERGIIAVGDSNTESVEMQKVNQLSADVTNAQALVFEKQAAYQAMQRTDRAAVTADDPTVAQLRNDIAGLRRTYAERRSLYLEGHPEMKSLSSQIEKAESELNRAIDRAYQRRLEEARSTYSAAVARETAARNAYAQQRTQAQRVNVDAARYLDLQTAVESKQKLLASLQQQLSETEVSARLRGSATSNVHWVEHAVLPGGRYNLSMKRNLQSAFPLGLILGLAAIFFLEYMDRSIKNPEELERVTRFASLGVIPAASSMGSRQYGYGASYGRTPRLRAIEGGDKPAGVELIPHTDARSPVSEAYRAFRTSLLLASASSPKVIVITSSFAREGKTTTSVNLATVLAQMGKPVLLVDADLRRPRLQKVFTGKMNLGLVNYLAANIPLDDILQPTEVPNLSVALSGPIPPNPSELLASDRMKHLIEEVRSRFAYVIFDSPPVLAVTDAVVLAANADGVVLTVHGGQTPREHVQRSAERLRQANIPVLGAILNNLDLHQYGYTYRKSYYDYYQSEEEDEGAEGRAPRAESK